MPASIKQLVLPCPFNLPIGYVTDDKSKKNKNKKSDKEKDGAEFVLKTRTAINEYGEEYEEVVQVTVEKPKQRDR